MSAVRSRDAHKRYLRTTIVSMLFYVICVFGVSFFLRLVEVATPIKYVLALMPSLFIWWFVWGAGRYFKECDEYERSRLTSGLLFGVAVLLIFTSGWGFLELLADAPALPVFYIFPLFVVAASIGRFLQRNPGEKC